jgi:GDP-L-fucose synthase
MKVYSNSEHINVGSGDDIAISDLAQLISKVVGFTGEIVLDRSRPDGTPQKLMDGGKLDALGWRPRISLEDGLKSTYAAFLAGSH